MKHIPIVLLCLALLGADECEQTPPAPPPPPPPGASPFCYGTPTLGKRAGDLVDAAYAAIIGGEESTDRRATLRVALDSGRCTGVAYGPHTALTAAHCTVGSEKVTFALGGYSQPPYFDHVDRRESPEYLQYLRQGNTPYELAKADVTVLKVDGARDGSSDSLPGPYVDKIFDPENPAHASRCLRFIAQGWGQWEGSGLSLRECTYDIDYVEERLVVNDHDDEDCRICFGDSGGPMYAEMDNGELWLVGFTRTTGSTDCRIRSTHVRASRYEEWIKQSIEEMRGSDES